MADLKPCPFCGGKVKGYLDNHKKAMIECEKCNMYFGVKLEIGCELVEGWKATFDSKEELFEAWNTRKPMEAVVAELEKLKEEGLKCEDCSFRNEADCYGLCSKGKVVRAISIVRGKE